MPAGRARATGRPVYIERVSSAPSCTNQSSHPDRTNKSSSSAPRISNSKPVIDHMALDCRTSQPAAAACVPADYDEAARPRLGVSSTDGGDMLMQGSAMAMDVPLMWNDEGRMKRELVAWAKAVASMAIRESMRC
uniref:Uncharacterized protein n=1 Tax=Avena sativa TaxID=4498 RepID=A0ACD5USA0_AVESA